MKLTTKLVSAFMLVVILLATLSCFLAVHQEVRRFDEEVHDTVHDVGSALEPLLLVLIRSEGPEAVAQLIRTTENGHQDLTIRWINFDAPPGDPRRPNIPFDQLQNVPDDPRHMEEVQDYDKDGLMDSFWMIRLEGKPRSGLEMSHTTKELEDATWAAIMTHVLKTVTLLIVAGLAMTWIGIRGIGRPLDQLIDKTREIGRGDLSHPIHIQSRDELAHLGNALNEMCDQLADSQESVRAEAAARMEAVQQLRHAERLQMIGRFASGIAHELGTPLNVVSGRAGLIESGKLSDEEVTTSAKIIKSQVDRISSIIRQLLDFARRKPIQKMRLDLRTIVGQTVELVAPMVEKQNISIEVAEEDRPLLAIADPTQIQQVLNNLLVNAAQAMPQGGTVNVRFDRQTTRPPDAPAAEEHPYVCIQVQDQGEGISDEDRKHIFEPFFTTKTVGQGTGLGLSISLGIAHEHNGWIDVETNKGSGSCFSLYLPAPQGE